MGRGALAESGTQEVLGVISGLYVPGSCDASTLWRGREDAAKHRHLGLSSSLLKKVQPGRERRVLCSATLWHAGAGGVSLEAIREWYSVHSPVPSSGDDVRCIVLQG
jgi:hypothetical protein